MRLLIRLQLQPRLRLPDGLRMPLPELWSMQYLGGLVPPHRRRGVRPLPHPPPLQMVRAGVQNAVALLALLHLLFTLIQHSGLLREKP